MIDSQELDLRCFAGVLSAPSGDMTTDLRLCAQWPVPAEEKRKTTNSINLSAMYD